MDDKDLKKFRLSHAPDLEQKLNDRMLQIIEVVDGVGEKYEGKVADDRLGRAMALNDLKTELYGIGLEDFGWFDLIETEPPTHVMLLNDDRHGCFWLMVVLHKNHRMEIQVLRIDGFKADLNAMIGFIYSMVNEMVQETNPAAHAGLMDTIVKHIEENFDRITVDEDPEIINDMVTINIPVNEYLDMIHNMSDMTGAKPWEIADVAYCTLGSYMDHNSRSTVTERNLERLVGYGDITG